MRIEINISADSALRTVGDTLPALISGVPRRFAPVAHTLIEEWYRTRGDKWFDNPSLSTHGAGRKDTGWARQVAKGWEKANVATGDDGFSIAFMGDTEEQWGLGNFIHGRTITPKRARFLTIPVTPEAHARPAKQFEEETGHKLFPAKGGLLFKRAEDAPPVMAYVFKKSVTIRPLFERAGRKAIPDAEELEEPILSRINLYIDRETKK